MTPGYVFITPHTQPVPTRVLLSTQLLYKDLDAHVGFLVDGFFQINNPPAIELIFDSIRDERSAEVDMACFVVDLVDSMDLRVVELYNSASVLQAFNVFGQRLLTQLRRLGLYERGRLAYRFDGWVRDDIVIRHDWNLLYDSYPL